MKLLFAEDDPDVSRSVTALLTRSHYSVDPVSNGYDALTYLTGGDYDACIMDIMMPGMNGDEVVRKARAAGSQVPVIMLTAMGEVEDRINGLDAGADDYLAKPFGMMEMVSRIRAVLRRSAPPADRPLQIGRLRMDPMAHTVYAGENRVELTLKEFDLLRLLMEHPGRVFTRDQLLEQIWSTDYLGETRTVDVHIGTLRTKLGPCGDYIRTVRGVGYRLEETS